jgi:hypothetical protein
MLGISFDKGFVNHVQLAVESILMVTVFEAKIVVVNIVKVEGAKR